MILLLLLKIIIVVDIEGMLPAHDEEPELGEGVDRKRLGENVCQLIFGSYMLDSHFTFGNGMAEVVVLDVDVFGSRTHFGNLDHLDGSHVVFEYLATDDGIGGTQWEACCLDFLKETHQWQDIPK